MISYFNQFFFDIYPYIAGTVFLLGSLIRYDYGQYTWRAGSSMIMEKKSMRWASNLFHIGIIGIFFGHLFGMLTPHWVYAPILSVGHKQLMAMILGGGAGLTMLVGGLMLLKRRLTNPRVRANSTTADILILVILLIQVTLGLISITFSAQHLDGSEMMKLVGWAQNTVTFQGNGAQLLEGVDLIFKVHIVLGMTIFLLFPFTRLVHIWSLPLEYLTRRYQVVRNRH